MVQEIWDEYHEAMQGKTACWNLNIVIMKSKNTIYTFAIKLTATVTSSETKTVAIPLFKNHSK